MRTVGRLCSLMCDVDQVIVGLVDPWQAEACVTFGGTGCATVFVIEVSILRQAKACVTLVEIECAAVPYYKF